ncbi:Uncharacterised protein [Campylobacter jejuni]|nr:hypothetical protein X908_01865 [Campylobacter jejuni subsp. jejuni 81-176-DRH212]SQA79245.1 Uncharacterised protein [Campylobacter jejuni]
MIKKVKEVLNNSIFLYQIIKEIMLGKKKI